MDEKPMSLTEIYLQFGIKKALEVAAALNIDEDEAREIIAIGTGESKGDVIELPGPPPEDDEEQ
jgi:hypothetical protein